MMLDPHQTPFRDTPYQLANGIRESMLFYQNGKALLVVEGLYFLKLKAEVWLTFDQAYRLLRDNFKMSRRTVNEGLRDDKVFQRRKRKQPGAFRPGARPYEYRIPLPDELEAEFAPGQGWTASDHLLRSDLQNLTSYRKALHRELYIRLWCASNGEGFSMSRQLQADRLGVSKRTIRTYDQQLGHDHDAHYSEQRVTWDNWQRLPRYKKTHTPSGKPLGSRRWLRVYDYSIGKFESFPLVKFLAYKGLKAGLVVYVVERLPNVYFPYKRPDKSKFDMSDPGDYAIAHMMAREKAGFYRDREGRWHHRRE